MKQGVYAVRDKVVGETGPVFNAANDLAAIRAFKGLQFPKGSPSSDFQLVKVGEYETSETSHPVILEGAETEEGK